jgi:REP element-mobilizing transposase RayT
MELKGQSTTPRRSSIRLKGFDYSQPGGYFVTICVREGGPVLGEISQAEVQLNEVGKIADEIWQKIPSHKPWIELDEYVVMPNHFHGILIVHQFRRGEAFAVESRSFDRPHANASPLQPTKGTNPGSISAVIQNFKAISTRKINQTQHTPGKKFWQRGYYDRIIRNEGELIKIRKYILENPMKWELDEYHPAKLRRGQGRLANLGLA